MKKTITSNERSLISSLISILEEKDLTIIISDVINALTEYDSEDINLNTISIGNFNPLIVLLDEFDFQEQQEQAHQIIKLLNSKTSSVECESSSDEEFLDGETMEFDEEMVYVEQPANFEKSLISILQAENLSLLEEFSINSNRPWNHDNVIDILLRATQRSSYPFLLTLFRKMLIELELTTIKGSHDFFKGVPLLEYHFASRNFPINFNIFIKTVVGTDANSNEDELASSSTPVDEKPNPNADSYSELTSSVAKGFFTSSPGLLTECNAIDSTSYTI